MTMDGYLNILWWTLTVAGVIGCGLCAGLETGVYSLNRVKLHLLAQRGDPTARILAGLSANPNRLLAALLIGTNCATNLTSSALGIILESKNLHEWQIILLDVVIVTPLLFIVAETLPKDIFAAHADRLVYPFARLLDFLVRLFTWTGLLPLITGVGDLALRALGGRGVVRPYQPRRLVESLVKEGVGYGLISDEQSAIVERVLDLGTRTVGEEMVPWAKVVCVRENDDPATIWKIADQTPYTRVPVVTATGKVAGTISVLDALMHEKAACPAIRDLMQPVMTIRGHVPVRTALKQLQSQRTAMAVVTDQDDYPVGIVTVKDLVEPITGELASW